MALRGDFTHEMHEQFDLLRACRREMQVRNKESGKLAHHATDRIPIKAEGTSVGIIILVGSSKNPSYPRRRVSGSLFLRGLRLRWNDESGVFRGNLVTMVPGSAFEHFGFFNHDRVNGNILMSCLHARARLADMVNHILTFHDLAKYAIAIALG